MGLDFSHGGGYLWSCSGYVEFVMRLQEEMSRYPSNLKPDPIQALLDHSGCEGHFEPWECESIANRMLELVSHWNRVGDFDRQRAEQMAQGMRRAASRGERFLYLYGIRFFFPRAFLSAGPKDAAWKLRADYR